MSAISKSLGRTVKTNIILYTTDNKGRDGYITYNNGGFWKDNIKQIRIKSSFPRHINKTFYSLYHQAPSLNYYSDGRGRDSYIVDNNAGLTKEFIPLANRQKLSQYLRGDIPLGFNRKLKHQKIFLTPSDKENYLKKCEIEKNVISRLYDQSLENFRNKMKKESIIFDNSFNSLKVKKNNIFKISKQKLLNNPINEKMNKKLMNFKLNKTNNYFNLYNKKNIIGNLNMNNISNKQIINYNTPNNSLINSDIKNSFNCLSSGNWNPIMAKFNNINEYSDKKMNTFSNDVNFKKTCVKSKINDSFLKENEKAKTMRIESIEKRPKSYRRLFQKRQIFNKFKPFLVDDFQEFSDYE